MSPINPRHLLILAVAAFVLRASCAVLTEHKPIFPPYYYTDARQFHEFAASVVTPSSRGPVPSFNGALSERLQILLTITTYRIFGPRPLAIKLVNSFLGATAAAALAWAFGFLFDPRAALLTGAAVATWPSDIFYTSQNLKESPTQALAFVGIGALLNLGLGAKVSGSRATVLAFLATACLIGAGMYRSYILLTLSIGIGSGFILMNLFRPRLVTIAPVAVLLVALGAYPLLSHSSAKAFAARADGPSDMRRAYPMLVPVTLDNKDPSVVYHPTSPEGLSLFRSSRQASDRNWARQNSSRDISTQIFPEARFSTWADVIAYVPKGAFYILFMPLPGLYPLDYKIGRILAAAENTVLFALALVAVAGVLKGRKDPVRFGLLLFFATMAVGGSLLEFDLGSAGRHKLLYLPVLFPFAFEEILRRRESRRLR